MSILRAASLVAAVSCLLPSGSAHAGEELRDATEYYQLDIPDGWVASQPAPGAEDILLARTQAALGQALAVTRVRYPNPRRTREEYRDQVVAGIRAATRDFTKLTRRDRTLATVPVTDVVFRHRTDSGARVTSVRFLFFRTFTVMLTVTGPADGHRRSRRATAALVSSFQPYFD